MNNKALKSVLTVFVLLLLGITSGQAQNQRIKVMCFNIRMSGEVTAYQAKPFVDLILQHKPDVIALQEVDYRGARSGNKDLLTEIASQTGMFPLFGKAIALSGSGDYGVAILSKYPIGTSNVLSLTAPTGTKEKRVALISEIAFPNNFTLKFVSTHLDNSTDDVRAAMVQDLNSGSVLSGSQPTILGGDFNAQPSTGPISAGMSLWQRICDATNTFPNDPATSKIDYIFAYPKNKWNVIKYSVFKTDISDHRALVAEVEYIK